MNKKLEKLIDNLMKGKCGLLYNYLNEIEDLIYENLTPQRIMMHYNLKENQKNRCKCPIHDGSNETSLHFSSKGFKCHSCNTTGTLLEFIRLISKLKTLNDAKIYATNNFTNISLDFYSVEDYKNKISIEITNRFKITGSYNLTDYYDISLLPNGYCRLKNNSLKENNPQLNPVVVNSNQISLLEEITRVEKDEIEKYGMPKYIQSVMTATSSTLISFLNNAKNITDKKTLDTFMCNKYGLKQNEYTNHDILLITNKDFIANKSLYGILNRVLFPIKDHFSNTVVGYLCRSLTPEENIKWLLISDFDDKGKIVEFNKGNFLYNLNKIKDSNPSELWITESITDAIKLESLGYYAVSALGVSLTLHQIDLLNKFFSKDIKINIFFDNDTANEKNIGKSRSYNLCHQLHNYGFNNLNVIQTNSIFGKDLTECSSKINDDNLLKEHLNYWYNNKYTFNINHFNQIDSILSKIKTTNSELRGLSPAELDNISKTISLLENYIETNALKQLDLSKLLKINIDQFN
ncbi:toprim domain-containing protein, partial [Clostridium sp.]